MQITKLTIPTRKSLQEKGLDTYFKQIKHQQKLTSEMERVLAARIQAGDPLALNKLVEANLKFVIAVSKNYRNQGLTFNDLISEGNLGLIKAAKRFDGNSGCRFITYAVWWIRQGILIALADQSRFMNIAPGRIRTISQINKATRGLTQKLSREPSSVELATHLGVSDDLIAECSVLAMSAHSLTRNSDEGNQQLEEILSDKNATPSDKGAGDFLLSKKVAGILNTLGERKASVIRMSFGIGGGTIYNLKDISEKLNLSKERIRQIKAQAISVLRNQLQTKRLAY